MLLEWDKGLLCKMLGDGWMGDEWSGYPFDCDLDYDF